MLSALILIPLLGAVLISVWPGQSRKLALGILTVNLVWTLLIIAQFDIHTAAMQFRESVPWLDYLGLGYELGIDGIALPLLFINSVLSLVAVFSSDSAIRRPKLYYALLLTITGAVAGTFMAQNLLLFFIFYELELIPLYLLIAIWGGARRGYAATKFLIYTALSGALILAAFLGLVWLTGSASFDYVPGLAQGLPLVQQAVLMGALLVGFGIKIPLFPFHTWLPDAHVEASTPISVLLAGVLLKLGTYGLLRFCFGLFPEAWSWLAPWIAWWAVVSILYGSLAAIAQQDMKKMVAYSSVGHMGYILLACAAANPISILATVFQMISHGLISALLFLLVGVVYQKTGTRDLKVLRGLLNPERGLPITGSLMVLGVMASAGIPGMVGFISEFLVYRGSFETFSTQTLVSMIGSGLTAVYFLLLVNRAFFGRLQVAPETIVGKTDVILPAVKWQEHSPALALILMIFTFGLNPTWMTRWIETSTTAMIQIPSQTAMAVTPSSIASTLIAPSFDLSADPVADAICYTEECQ
ncbi:MAG: NADH-quinone oxidoreductase subunit M [Cyanobacteria bacterium J06635_1]